VKPGQVGRVEMDTGVREEVVARQVIFVAMTVEDPIDPRQMLGSGKQTERGVDDRRLFRALDYQTIAVRILPLVSPIENRGHSQGLLLELLTHGVSIPCGSPAVHLESANSRSGML